MNRCATPVPSRHRRTATALAATFCLGLFTAAMAHAQAVQREFPVKALRGSMVVVQPPLVAMDDRPTRFSPGARILDTTNKLVRPATLVNRELTVNYTLDQRGQIQQVWLLTEAEARQKRAGHGVQRNYVFESQQQTLPAAAGTPAPATSN